MLDGWMGCTEVVPKMCFEDHWTECFDDYKNSEAHGLVYHFGAVFGNIEQTESYHVKTMDYYVKETMENIQNFLFKCI